MRRGSLSERTIKCSKPGCACAKDPKARHGPYFSLTRGVEGKTRSRFLTPEQAALARQQIEAGHEFRSQLETYWEGCEDWPTASWTDPPGSPPGRPKKGAPKQSPKRNRPGNRKPLRSSVDRRLGFGRRREGGAAPGSARGRPRPGATTQGRHQRPPGSGTTLALRRLRPVSWRSREDLRNCPGARAPATRLPVLWAMPERILAARDRALGLEWSSLTPGVSAPDGERGRAGELRRERGAVAGAGGSGSQCPAGGTSG